MEESSRTLVILFSMHRCGSSLTANILQRLGLSLGPFELNGAAPSNPYGHFEAVPFLLLNRELQGLAFGFKDDLANSRQVHAQFCATEGEWPDEIPFPEDLLERGRSLIRALVSSGKVSGFKDPRTVLTWPFWERVLEDFPGLRVVPVSLVRSPYEIAMSLVSRRKGWCSYWDSLDVVAVHLRRQKAILECWDDRPPPLCFGSPSYLKVLESVVWRCGLTWDTSIALDVFDRTCVNQAPAAVLHPAQDLFESLLGDLELSRDVQGDRARLESDARSLEALRLQQWNSIQDQLTQAQAESQRARNRVAEAELQVCETHAQVHEAHAQVHEAQARLVEAERQRDQTQAQLDTALAEIRQASSRWDEIQARLNESHHRALQAQQRALQAQQRALQAQQRALQAQQRALRARDRALQAQDRALQARERELQAWQRNEALGARLARFESHPILGPALRGRRQLRRWMAALATGSTRS
jgi:hypothetical protein